MLNNLFGNGNGRGVAPDMWMRIKDRIRYSDFGRTFHFQDALATGRSMLLANTFLASIANIFVTGVFYTGFLTVSGIDIVRVGMFSLVSPILLSRFKKRANLLLFNHIFYYVCVVLATTVMPMLVSDYGQRTFWFAFFLFIGNVSNALIGSGTAAWHINFLPPGEVRNIYFSYSNMISSFVGTLVAIGSSLLADSLAGSPRQGQVITILRFVAFGLFVISGLMLYLVPKEFPYHQAEKKITVLDIVKTPCRSRKFLLTTIILMLWNGITTLNGSTWIYYVLNTVGIKYFYMFITSIVCALSNVFLLRYWRRAIHHYTWFTMLFVVVLLTGLMEFFIGFSTSQTIWVSASWQGLSVPARTWYSPTCSTSTCRRPIPTFTILSGT